MPVAGTGRLRHGNRRSATLVRTDRADLRQPIRPGVRVVQRRRVGAPTRRADPFPEPRERLDGRGPRRADLRLQSRCAPQLLRRELVVELEIGRSQHPLGAEVHREGDGPRSEIVRQVPQRAEAVFVPDEGEEARSDGVLAEAARPFERKVGERVDPRKDVDGFHPENVGKVAVGDPKVAMPSMNQIGCPPLVIHSLPKTSFTACGRPSTVSRWRMCVYSCEISS